MLPARDASELAAAVERARSIALRGFGNAEVYLEKLLEKPRHIEFQMLGDRHGALRHLYERDCSVQRRHQKVIEEAGAPAVDRARLNDMAASIADTLARAGYDNIGTVEMLMARDGSTGEGHASPAPPSVAARSWSASWSGTRPVIARMMSSA